MTDLEKRIKEFRREWFITDEGVYVDLEGESKDFKDMLLAEVKYLQENPPDMYEHSDAGPVGKLSYKVGHDDGWQSFADIMMRLIGEKK